jgi:hypothetical protein
MAHAESRRHDPRMAWEPPFEDEFGRDTLNALFEINAKLADIREHLAIIRVLLGEEEDGEEED